MVYLDIEDLVLYVARPDVQAVPEFVCCAQDTSVHWRDSAPAKDVSDCHGGSRLASNGGPPRVVISPLRERV